MERTPEEIRKSLECSAAQVDGRCEEYAACVCCPLFVEEDVSAEDIAAYIQRLEARERDLFDLLSSAWFGKRCYFRQDDGNVYSRLSGEYMSLDQAIDELAHELIIDRECEQSGKDINAPRWIRVDDSLPEISDVVLVIASGKPRENIELHDAFLIASFWGDEGWIADEYEEWDAVNVTHWMPLPESPKEGNA